MIAAILALLLATVIAVKVKSHYRFPAFAVSVLMLLPISAYIVAGTGMVLAEMTGSDIVGDFFSIAKQCYTEPFYMLSEPGEGMRPLNSAFAVSGTLVIIATVVSVCQGAVWFNTQRDKQRATSH